MKKSFFISTLLLLLLGCKSNVDQNISSEKQHDSKSQSQILQELDTNKDGKISKQEVKGPLVRDFDHLDENNDGFLSFNEIQNHTNHPPREGKGKNENAIKASISVNDIDDSIMSVEVNSTYFIKNNFKGDFKKELVDLNGIKTMCYIFTSNSQATEHEMGPWCPENISDTKDRGGIWFHDGKVYDVSGHFIANLDEFYQDDQWELYRDDGTIKVTKTKEGCLAAAKPNVEATYHNYCVECLPEYFKDQETTYVIPVKPRYLNKSQELGRSGVGVAFNGVKFDPPAPTHAILAAHTIAPLDDHGGHVNPHGGYHYHAVTGSTKEIAQADNHAPILGYALDGFGIYARLDKNGDIHKDLDECGGHVDSIRGYHYHVGMPGDNQILKCLHGLSGYVTVKE